MRTSTFAIKCSDLCGLQRELKTETDPIKRVEIKREINRLQKVIDMEVSGARTQITKTSKK